MRLRKKVQHYRACYNLVGLSLDAETPSPLISWELFVISRCTWSWTFYYIRKGIRLP